MSVVAYRIGGHDNGTLMFDEDSSVPKCPRCNYRLNFCAHNPLYRQRRRRRSDLLSTYDGAGIVTKVFQQFVEQGHYPNAHCLGFLNDPEHFHLVVNEPTIEFDAKRRGTRFLNLCPVCENYEEVIGSNPVYLRIADSLSDGFYRSDLEFGGRNAKHPLILIAPETRARMIDAGLKGIMFDEAYGI